MKPFQQVHARVRSALQPFVRYRDDWIFHYPVYLNTFCFTYDLAALLSDGAASGEPDPLGGNFRRHEKWGDGLPKFTYGRDIEIFVAVRPMIEQAQREGHEIRREHCVCFTRYDIRTVFVRRRSAPIPPPKWLLVTDVPETAKELLKTWEARRPRWLTRLGIVRLSTRDIRSSSDRELHDLFSEDGKIYVFSAPMAHFLEEQPAKYEQQNAGVHPIPTFFVFRCNSGVEPEKVKQLKTAVAKYYRLILGGSRPATFLHPRVGWEYGRIASTVGQPHPFWEVHKPADKLLSLRGNMKLVTRYAKILVKHHRN
jgi:hypothetical protein